MCLTQMKKYFQARRGEKVQEISPEEYASRREVKAVGLGDRIERLVKPIAKALRLGCLDENGHLKPESPCAKKRDRINNWLSGK